MKKILIISTNAIGDTYLSMSAIPILKKNLNNVVIDFVIEKHSAFLFECEEIRNLVIAKRNVRHLFTDVFQIRKERYDYVFSFFPGLVNSFFLLFVKSKNKGGFFNFIRKKEWADSNQLGFVKKGFTLKTIMWNKRSNFLERVTAILKKFVFSFSEIRKYVFSVEFNLEKYKNYIVIHPFSRVEEKSLSQKQLNALIKFFEDESGGNIVVLGDDKLLKIQRNFSKHVKFVVNPKINELVNLIHCKLFISVDSFPLHVADAYNTNFVGLFSLGTYPEAVLINKRKAIKFKRASISKIPLDDLINKFNKFLMKNAL